MQPVATSCLHNRGETTTMGLRRTSLSPPTTLELSSNELSRTTRRRSEGAEEATLRSAPRPEASPLRLSVPRVTSLQPEVPRPPLHGRGLRQHEVASHRAWFEPRRTRQQPPAPLSPSRRPPSRPHAAVCTSATPPALRGTHRQISATGWLSCGLEPRPRAAASPRVLSAPRATRPQAPAPRSLQHGRLEPPCAEASPKSPCAPRERHLQPPERRSCGLPLRPSAAVLQPARLFSPRAMRPLPPTPQPQHDCPPGQPRAAVSPWSPRFPLPVSPRWARPQAEALSSRPHGRSERQACSIVAPGASIGAPATAMTSIAFGQFHLAAKCRGVVPKVKKERNRTTSAPPSNEQHTLRPTRTVACIIRSPLPPPALS
eukprot:scaffold15145_cov54-Phaeocystis_antarctica.AAC.3